MDDPRLGIDIGGTFTDVVMRLPSGCERMAKIPTVRADPSTAVERILATLLPEWGTEAARIARFVHGTTVATNAVLERKGATIGILATQGFEDVLEIGRQRRRDMYDLAMRPETPAFLAPGRRRRGVVEEIGPDGAVIVPLDEASLVEAADALVAEGVEAIAVAFLFSFANPEHERAAARLVAERHPDIFVSLSSEVDPAFREYERTAVTAFDAYVKPVLDRYLARMEERLDAAGVAGPFQVMQSRGGVQSARVARARPVQLFLSGPAAGVIGGRAAGRSVGLDDLITVDIGGTSCDIALVRAGRPVLKQEGTVGGYALRVPMVDVNAIGAGGGSIAWLDAGGGLRVGPHSAGADPGPAAYARGGTEATVTDASIVLGYIDPAYFAGGAFALEPALARRAIEERIAAPMGLAVEEAALGIHRVLNAQMAEGIRLVSVGRGIDPRGFALVAAGGGGGLHATALAEHLGIGRVLVPRHPGVLAASGLLEAPIEHAASAAFPVPLAALEPALLRETLAELDAKVGALMATEAVDPARVARRHFADVCYVGQSHHLEVPLDAAGHDLAGELFRAFRAAHVEVYGHATDAPARIVNLRAVWAVPPEDTAPPRFEAIAGDPGKGTRAILLPGLPGPVEARVLDRAHMEIGFAFAGPTIIEQADTTTLVPPGWWGRIADGGGMLLEREAAR